MRSKSKKSKSFPQREKKQKRKPFLLGKLTVVWVLVLVILKPILIVLFCFVSRVRRWLFVCFAHRFCKWFLLFKTTGFLHGFISSTRFHLLVYFFLDVHLFDRYAVVDQSILSCLACDLKLFFRHLTGELNRVPKRNQ